MRNGVAIVNTVGIVDNLHPCCHTPVLVNHRRLLIAVSCVDEDDGQVGLLYLCRIHLRLVVVRIVAIGQGWNGEKGQHHQCKAQVYHLKEDIDGFSKGYCTIDDGQCEGNDNEQLCGYTCCFKEGEVDETDEEIVVDIDVQGAVADEQQLSVQEGVAVDSIEEIE